ncbi:hypothetical protein BDV96DRAFT_665054 [Lophiotrema nucula]|uniref:Rhodopsin domain-containing protein n=1 Tax=Lophiotrema nucula TaxID=690887 RepID=A0A6A5Z0W3_9PLEO|nr:hypothetical protein BDV96DRAFT_665054 [Lophiotrema nucula]
MASEEGPRHAAITADDRGALLAMTTWFLGCTLVLCVATRLIVRFTTNHLPGIDDVLVVAAAVLAIGSTVAISLAVESGLGRRYFLLKTENIVSIQKEMYAATILYILTVGVSKISITAFLGRLSGTATHKTIIIILGIVILCWTIAITFGVAFACALPHPWETFTGKCISTMPFWIGSTTVDVLTDIIMIVLPIQMVWNLQMELGRKATVVFIFALRLVLIVVSILRVVYLNRFVGNDPTFDSLPYGIVTQCHSALSVIVACTPGMKPFLDHAQSGMLSASLGKHGQGTTFGQDSFNMQAFSKNSAQNSNGSRRRTKTGVALGSQSDTNSMAIEQADSSIGSVYVQDSYGRIIKQRLADIASASSPRPSRASSRSPPRPPPPPDELRPDLSIFTAHVRRKVIGL